MVSNRTLVGSPPLIATGLKRTTASTGDVVQLLSHSQSSLTLRSQLRNESTGRKYLIGSLIRIFPLLIFTLLLEIRPHWGKGVFM